MTGLDVPLWLTKHDVRITFVLFTTMLESGFIAQPRPVLKTGRHKSQKYKNMSIINVHISTGLLRDGCVLYRYNYIDDASNPSALVTRLRSIFQQYANNIARDLPDASLPFFVNITVSPKCPREELPLVFGSELNENDLSDVPF